MRVHLLTRRQGERGAVAITVGLLMIPMLALGAFTLDLGNTYAQAQAYSAGADSAALAVVNTKRLALLSPPTTTQTCASVVSADTALAANDPAKAQNIALRQANSNTNFGTVLTSSEVATTLTCTANGVLQANVTITHAVPTTLGRVVGVASLNAKKSAMAALGGSTNGIGVKPVGVCQYQANQIMADAAQDAAAGASYRAELIGLSKIWTGNNACGSEGAGNWGWIDCGQGNGASALGDALTDGCPTPLALTGNPPTYSTGGSPGNKGNSANVRTGMQTIMDKTVKIPVYDQFTGNGANATFRVIGFMEVQICGFDGDIKGSCYDGTVGMDSNQIQVRYVSYQTLSDLNSLCGIGASVCQNYNVLVTNLMS